MSDEEAELAEQQEFIDWLESKNMYSGFESVQTMRKSMRVWREMRKEADAEKMELQSKLKSMASVTSKVIQEIDVIADRQRKQSYELRDCRDMLRTL